MTHHDHSRATCLLNDLLRSTEKLAVDKELSDDQILDLVGECERHIAQLKEVMDASQDSGARDGAGSGDCWALLRSDQSIAGLIREVDHRFRCCVEELAARRQQVAEELGDLRRTQRAAKAYQGIEVA